MWGIGLSNPFISTLYIFENTSNKLVVSYEKSKLSISDLIGFINKQNINIFDILTDDGDLEDVFVRLTKN